MRPKAPIPLAWPMAFSLAPQDQVRVGKSEGITIPLPCREQVRVGPTDLRGARIQIQGKQAKQAKEEGYKEGYT